MAADVVVGGGESIFGEKGCTGGGDDGESNQGCWRASSAAAGVLDLYVGGCW